MNVAVPALETIQEALRDQGLDAWLLYDFRGSNPLFARILGAGVSGRLTTRRRFLMIPVLGDPVLLVHSIEAGSHAWPWSLRSYTGHASLLTELHMLTHPARRVAVEYSPGCAIPYASYVDGGTLDVLRALGLELVSSENVVQMALARWDEAALSSHQEAARLVDDVLRHAFAYVQSSVRDGREPTEYEIQQRIRADFDQHGLVTAHDPDIAVNAHSGNPHYSPDADTSSPMCAGDWLLIDLWARLDRPGSVYADITWVACLADAPTAEQQHVFATVVAARDLGLRIMQDAAATHRVLSGWEVDRGVRDFLTGAGYGEYFTHRTGHSLSPEALHGDGVCLDDFETHDTRLLLPGVGVTIEPGIYQSHFGVRSEINVYMDTEGPRIFTPVQDHVVCLPVRA